MTDEQVDRIVRALEGSGELWSALGVAAVSAVLGALFALGIQWFADWRRKGEADAAARAAAVKDAAVLAARFAIVSGSKHGELMMNIPELAAPIRVDLVMLERSGEVARWWTRQILLLAVAPTEKSGLFTRDEMTHRAVIATGVHRRLQGWALGKVRVEEFNEANDEAFLSELKGLQK